MKGKLISLVPDLMHKRRIRSVDLQKESGLSAMTIHTIANGALPKTSKTLCALCGALNCQPNDLLLFVPEEE
jgi:DNA-binding Xre family transcriptional regulator